MHNEEENVAETLGAISEALEAAGWTFQLVPVNDGSTDGTGEVLIEIAKRDTRVTPVSYVHNRGRGYALRRGFEASRGALVASMDADLSYSPETLVSMVRALTDDPETAVVLASPYMPGGSVDGVPLVRLILSRAGNWVLRHSLPRPVHTSTGIVRAYRAEALRAIDPGSDGKEIHLEILSQAMSLGYRVVEIPAVLRSRKKGRSKFRPRATIASHLTFSVLAKPAVLFGMFGLALLFAGVGIGFYLFRLYLSHGLNPERPLMLVMALLLLGGAGALAFAVIASQLLELRRAMTRLQADMRRLKAEEPGE
jgi:dolichol-phosphate mannosyltransferase